MNKEEKSMDFFDKIEYKNAVTLGVRKVLGTIKEKALEKYNAYANSVSGMNDSQTNDYYRKISWEFSNYLAELDKEINSPVFPRQIPFDITTLIGKTKNQITDIICPMDRRGTVDYIKQMHKAQHLANALEGFLMEAFMLGYGLNAQLSEEEKAEIDEHWKEKTQTDLRNAYDRGSRALVMLLEARMASSEVDNELQNRGL